MFVSISWSHRHRPMFLGFCLRPCCLIKYRNMVWCIDYRNHSVSKNWHWIQRRVTWLSLICRQQLALMWSKPCRTSVKHILWNYSYDSVCVFERSEAYVCERSWGYVRVKGCLCLKKKLSVWQRCVFVCDNVCRCDSLLHYHNQPTNKGYYLQCKHVTISDAILGSVHSQLSKLGQPFTAVYTAGASSIVNIHCIHR